VIDHEEADALGLPVRPISDYEHLAVAREAHRRAEDGHAVIAFDKLDDFLTAHASAAATADDVGGGEQDNEQEVQDEDGNGNSHEVEPNGAAATEYTH
jgi:hypothetical protein